MQKKTSQEMLSEAWIRATHAMEYLENARFYSEMNINLPASSHAHNLAMYWRERSAVETIAWVLGEDWVLEDIKYLREFSLEAP